MQPRKFDFSHLNSNVTPTGQKLDFSNLNTKNPESDTVDTFLGKMPRHVKSLEPGTPENKAMMEEMLGAAIGAPGLKIVGKGVASFGKGIKSLLTKIKPKELAYGVQKGHDLMHENATGLLNEVKEGAKEMTGMSSAFPVSGEMIESMRPYFSKTKATEELLAKAKRGNYEALHDLQSDLWQKATQNKSSPLAAEQNLGEEIFEKRKELNDLIYNHLKQSGYPDLAEKLSKGRDIYRRMKEIYYDHPGVAQLVEKGMRKVPKNPLELFSEESDPMKKVLAEHPEVSKAVETHKTAENFIKNLKGLKNFGLGSAAVGGTIYGATKLSDIVNSLSDLGD